MPADGAPAADRERHQTGHGEGRQHLPAGQPQDVDATLQLGDQHARQRDADGGGERQAFRDEHGGVGDRNLAGWA